MDIATIDEITRGDRKSGPGGAERKGPAGSEAETRSSSTSRSDTIDNPPPAAGRSAPPRRGRSRLAWIGVVVLIALAAIAGQHVWQREQQQAAAAPQSPPRVTVSRPLQATVGGTTIFLGQFAAVDAVELRAQVGGKLTAISFRDGQIVKKGDPLFAIDPRPFQIRLDQAEAQLRTAEARSTLADEQLWRAQQLKQTQYGTVESVDQRTADQRSAVAAIETAKAAIRDAQLDLEFSQVAAPLSGRIGAHLVSIGNLVSGSREGSAATTLLATIVSLDPIYLDFDMSEADYRAYQRAHGGSAPQDEVAISLDGDEHFDHHGTLDFIDNAVNRSSGTIRARATVPNSDLAITPGQFARLRVPSERPGPALLLPPAAIVPDQSRQVVMTVGPEGTVTPKPVEIGGLYRGLQVIRSGLTADDTVVIDGLVRVRPGAKVSPNAGTIAMNTDDQAQ
ncbi:MAG TPA: efflux RND transporter periplasmic adaptor subunit [Stellaceae bacterium]|jgi:RND family efflux transporter MFP subunit|nr:efflux RND transporter periplasmic adaptor subunit [Stellaceae bacterium]